MLQSICLIFFQVMVEKASGLSSIEKYVMREVFSNNGERLFINKTVGELLFDGYHQPSVAEVSELRGEELLPNNTFGIFYKVCQEVMRITLCTQIS